MLLRKRPLVSMASLSLVSSNLWSLMSVADPKYELAPLPKSIVSISTQRIKCQRYSPVFDNSRTSVVYETRPALSVATLMIPLRANSVKSAVGQSYAELPLELLCRDRVCCVLRIGESCGVPDL